MSKYEDLLKELSEASGISGDESEVAAIVRRELAGVVDSIEIDAMGNLIATKCGSDKSIMLDAHMDEIGLMVKTIDDKGFITFATVGGFYAPSLLNQKVDILTDTGYIRGVIGSKAPHVMKKAERDAPVEEDNLFIDVGASSAQEVCELGIEPGTSITIHSDFEHLLGDKVSGKALDNRAGVAAMIEVMKRIKTSATVYAVASVQEEVGLRGARTAAFKLNPDVCFVLDTTIPCDDPSMSPKDGVIALGKGPAITIMDGATIVPKRMLKYIAKKAEEVDVKIQKELSASGGCTNAAIVHMIRGGIVTGMVSIPVRYLHSPVETMSMADYEDTIELVTRMVEDIEEY
jgi:putative aminopeptidase FrvX